MDFRMDNRITVLDEKVISQIAAGEVIERPASVVKELVENAIDAKSSQITITIEDGGKKTIKVIDDGIGMTKDNAELAFHRHSTSKISTLRDLESISSLGFRGEALASIAAVSKVNLITRSRDEDPGVEILIEGGKLRHVKNAARNPGTTLIVSDLFYNTPARRKYMKTDRAELSKITDYITRSALIHPEIHFRLVHNDSEIINAPRSESLLDNLVHIYGREIAKEMLEIQFFDSELTIEGYISKPAVFRKSSSHISFFVNDRYITSNLLSSALKEGYGNLIMKNRFPLAVVSITIHPRKVDVNVHPSKLEIRFQDETKVFNSLVAAVGSSLSEKSLIPDMGDVSLQSPELEAFNITEMGSIEGLQDISSLVESKNQLDILTFIPPKDDKTIQQTLKDHKTANIPKLTLVGQILNTYIVAQSGENILIIDQHAAHERVLYEKLMTIQNEDQKRQQELLIPISLELTPKQQRFVTERMELLGSLGFAMEHFGQNTYQIRAVPSVFGESVNKSSIYDIIDELVSMGKTNKERELREKAMAIVACHSAIRGGDELSQSQMKTLIKSLYITKNSTSCPHGRPSILIMSKSDLETKFKRK
jgi:DNA mismatch repair protein MutL